MPITIPVKSANGALSTITMPDPVVNAAAPPVALFTTQVPATLSLNDGAGSAGDYELGMKFSSSVAGTITAIRFYKSPSETGTHTGRIWSSTGTLLASVVFTGETASGWQTKALTTPLAVTAGTTYVVSVNVNAWYAFTSQGFTSAVSNAGITAPVAAGILNTTPGSFPATSFANSNYFRDIVMTQSAPPPVVAPVVNNGSFSLTVPATSGQVVGTMSAINSPTSWAITAGNSAGYFSINSSGVISTTAALVAGNYSLTVSATNIAGSGTATASITAAARTGWPDASNTGVQPGITLTNYTGPLTIATAGTLIENKIINDTLTITADNVTVRNCIIRNMSWFGILADGNPINTRVEHCEIDGGAGTFHVNGIGIGGGPNSAILNCNIHGMVIAVNLWGYCLVKDNYIHDLIETDTNPDGRHFDGIAYRGGSANPGPTIDHNWVAMPQSAGGTACIFVKSENGPVTNVTVSNNYLTGNASMCAYSEAASGGTVSGVQFINNVMQKGIFGYWNIVGNTPVRSGNKDFATGANIDSAV